MSDTDALARQLQLQQELAQLMLRLEHGCKASYDLEGMLVPDSALQKQFVDYHLLPEQINHLVDPSTAKAHTHPQVVPVQSLADYYCILIPSEQPSRSFDLWVLANMQVLGRVVNDLPIGIIKLDQSWHAMFTNDYISYLLGADGEELKGRGWTHFFEPGFLKELFRYVSTHRDLSESFSGRTEITSPLGRKKVISVRGASYHDHNNGFDSCILTLIDVTHEQQTQSSLEYLAEHDNLTELYNRTAFMSKVALLDPHELKRALFLFIDLDKFKEINDEKGHKTGDQILTICARRIGATIRKGDIAARFGGDEFVVCLPNIKSAETVQSIAGKFASALNNKAFVMGEQFDLGVSIGLAWGGDFLRHNTVADDVFAEMLIAAADEAMYFVKKYSRRTGRYYKIYDESLKADSELQKHKAIELQLLMAHKDLGVRFQPIYNEHGQIISVEGLSRPGARAVHHTHIEALIDTAKGSELGLPFFAMLMENVLRAFADIHQAFPAIGLNLNADVLQLQSESFLDDLVGLCEKYQIVISVVRVEVTESVLEVDSKVLQKNLSALKAYGFKVSMDDFGVGFSSFKRLLSYDFDELKVDRYFISHLHEADKFYKTLKAISAIGESLGLDVLAEGVETEQQLAICKSLGVGLFQGFYLAKPRSVEDIKKMLSQSR